MEVEKGLKRYIATAKEMERKGLAFYKKALKQVRDPNSKGLLKFLISEEEDHLDYFTKLGKSMTAKEKSPKRVKQPLFKKTDYRKIKGDRAKALHIFNTALEMEERGIKFYLGLAKKTKNPRLRRFLVKLSNMEKRHFETIKIHQEAIYNYWYWEAVEQPRLET